MPHSDTCKKRLSEENEKSDEGARAKRARQRELEFYERAILESDHQAKRKFPAANEEDLTKRVRVGEESTTTFPSSSSSSTSHRVGAGSTVTGGEQRGEKRAAEDPPADCGQEDSVGQNEELRAGDGYIHGVLELPRVLRLGRSLDDCLSRTRGRFRGNTRWTHSNCNRARCSSRRVLG